MGTILKRYLKYLLILLIPFLLAVSLRITNDGGGVGLSVQNTRTSSLTFDGLDDFVDCGDILDSSPIMSMSVWINPDWNANIGIIGKFIESTSRSQYLFAVTGGNLYWLQSQDGTAWNTTVSDTSPSENVWHHIIGTNNGTTARLYIDGIEVGTPDTSPATSFGASTESLKIGVGYVAAADRYFNGQIVDVRIFNRALSSTEVGRIYRGEIITDGLVGHWPLQEGGLSEETYDVSGSDNHGDLTSFTLSDAWANVQNVSLYPQHMGYELYTDDATGLIEIKVPYKVDESKITPTISGYTKQSEHPGRGYNKSLLKISEYYRKPGLLRAA